MPDQNQTDPAQDQPTSTTPPPVSLPNANGPAAPSETAIPDFQNTVTTEDVPPMPQDNMQTPSPTEGDASMGSAAPTDLPDVTPPTPKKRFGGRKVIATILGVLLLVGGVGAGLMITQQRQLFEQQAKECWDADCAVTTRQSADGKKTTVFYERSRDKGAQDTKDIINDLGLSTSDPTKVFDTEDLLGVGLDGTTPDVPGAEGNPCKAGGACDSGLVCGVANTCMSSSLVTACKSGSTAACTSLCGQQPNELQNTCVPAGPGCNMDSSDASQLACTQWHWTNCIGGGTNGVGCGTGTNGGDGGDEPTPTPGSSASCQNIKAYSDAWVLLSPAQLSALEVGDQVNFCVLGIASAGTFDMARFTINGSLKPNTTTVRPGTTDFCQNFTIPAATTVFNVSAEIHHATLGWK